MTAGHSEEIVRSIDEIIALDRLGCLQRWREVFGRPPPKYLSPQFMQRVLLWELQERMLGAVSRKTDRALARIASGRCESWSLLEPQELALQPPPLDWAASCPITGSSMGHVLAGVLPKQRKGRAVLHQSFFFQQLASLSSALVGSLCGTTDSHKGDSATSGAAITSGYHVGAIR